jgi:DNA invertase Pin-like site-specific DNA recombinase
LRRVDCRRVAADTDARREAVVGYVHSDVAHGGLDVQRQAMVIMRLCARLEWKLVSLVYEGGPAKGRALSRPALGGALQRLEAGDVTCLVITDLRNLYRSVAEMGGVLEAIDRTGGRLVSLKPMLDTGSEAGRMATGVLGAVSEWERMRATERSRRGLAAAREQGALQPCIEPELKERIAQMRGAGMTLQAIVDELNDAGIPTVRGGAKWRVSSVQAALGYKRPART